MSTVEILESGAPVMRDVRVVDCDIHPLMMTLAPDCPVMARLSPRSRDYYAQIGMRAPDVYEYYPRVRNAGMRADANPPSGLYPGADPEFLCHQLLDEHGIDFGVMISIDKQDHYDDPTFEAEVAATLNDVQAEDWLDLDSRLRASIVVPHEFPEAAVAEIERRASDPRFVQVVLPASPREGAGDRRYWPMYKAAAAAGLPIAFHTGGYVSKHSAGWPSYYIEEHIGNSLQMSTTMIGLTASGVFDAVPDLKVVLCEGGVTWASALIWSMDAVWDQMPLSAPTLQRRPSEYIRDHVWFTSQPIDEPEDPTHLMYLLEHAGLLDRLMFATDYPHWDFDSPSQALPRALGADLRRAILAETACDLYGFPKQIAVRP